MDTRCTLARRLFTLSLYCVKQVELWTQAAIRLWEIMMLNTSIVWPSASPILPGVPYNTAYTIIVAIEADSMVKLINKLTLIAVRAVPTTTNKDRDWYKSSRSVLRFLSKFWTILRNLWKYILTLLFRIKYVQ